MPALFRKMEKLKPVYDVTYRVMLFLCKLRLGSFLFGSELFKGFRFCHCD